MFLQFPVTSCLQLLTPSVHSPMRVSTTQQSDWVYLGSGANWMERVSDAMIFDLRGQLPYLLSPNQFRRSVPESVGDYSAVTLLAVDWWTEYAVQHPLTNISFGADGAGTQVSLPTMQTTSGGTPISQVQLHTGLGNCSPCHRGTPSCCKVPNNGYVFCLSAY